MIEATAAPMKGSYMRTFSGHKFWPLDPRQEHMCIEDVAHHLAMKVRFNGAVKDFYSVAEHCVLGSYLVEQQYAFEFLMHDRTETWLFDMIRPVKHDSKLGDEFRLLETGIDFVSAQKWNLPIIESPVVKEVDDIMCEIEMEQVFLNRPVPLRKNPLPSLKLSFWDWRTAEVQFLGRYYELLMLRNRYKPEVRA